MTRILFVLLALTTGGACAQVLIDQQKALEGGVTPYDAPGFPVTITRPGVYKLSSDLKVPAGEIGIEIRASDVTVDLNGRTVSGPSMCQATQDASNVVCRSLTQAAGIENHGQRSTVRNGRLSGFLNGLIGRDHHDMVLEDLIASGNAHTGIALGAARNGHQLNRLQTTGNGRQGMVLKRNPVAGLQGF